ncbi:MAG: hypothetical protein P9L88_08435 [Candidatus Tantalella remota]|nr:hypothetical protein [Candidatus Tantalella remota]
MVNKKLNTQYTILNTAKAFCILLLLAPICHAAATPDIVTEVDVEEITIGDRIKVEVVAKDPKGFDLVFPETPGSLGEFSFVESRPVKSGWGSSLVTGREYVLSIYTTGTHVVPPVSVMYKGDKDDLWHTVESSQVPIEVRSVLSGRDADIRDLKGMIISGAKRAMVLMVIGLILIAALISAFLYFKRGGRFPGMAPKKEFTPEEIAYRDLRALEKRGLADKGLVKEYYSRLSDIIRRYLEGRFYFRAPEMTTEEFMEEVKKSPKLIDGQKGLLQDFLSHCDMVKFAKYGPTPLEMIDSFKAAGKFVDQARPVEEAKK